MLVGFAQHFPKISKGKFKSSINFKNNGCIFGKGKDKNC